jgi:PAS domain S-box-containing protein
MSEFDPTRKGFAEEIGYGPAERTEREAFVRLTPEECTLLESLHPVIEPFADTFVQAFYEHLLGFSGTRELVADENLRKRLLLSQREYLVSLFSGEYGAAHYESRLRIGFTHERIRLDPKWYLGAYALYISLLTPFITDHFSGDPPRAAATIMALHKVLNLDMQLAMEAYILASEEKLRCSNRELERLNRELDTRVRERTRELTTSEARTRSMIEQSPSLIYQVEPDGRFESLNRTLLERLGYEREELVGKQHDVIVAPEQRNTYLKEIERARKAGRHHFDIVLSTRDGQRVEAEVSAIVVEPHADRSPLRVWLRDVTERNRMSRQVQQAQKLAAVGQLAAILAHEVRNPLNAMELYLTLLDRRASETDGDLRDSMIRAIGNIRSEVTRLNELVNDFLLLARPGDLRRNPTDVHAIIDEVLQLEMLRAERQKVRIRREYGRDLPIAQVDQAKLKQALINVVTNALDVMPEGGTLRVRTRRKNGNLRIEVNDTGSGIPPGVNVFELFFTTKSKGTGMGLNIVEGIIQQHGGHVDVSSTEGKGTTLALEIPLSITDVSRRIRG